MSAKNVHFVSLGCPKNRVDTEVMVGVSEQEGFRLEGEAERADVIVINTCGFIDAAKEESIDTILQMARLKETGQCKKLVVTGCLSQRYSEQLAEQIPEVDFFLGSSDMLKLRAVLSSRPDRILVGNPMEYTYRNTDPRTVSTHRHSVWLKIAEGCNRTCSFCAIPSFRGKQRSRTIDDIVQEAALLVAAGARELNVISQDTIAYGRDRDPKACLEDLVAALCTINGLKWLRLYYLYPQKLSDRAFSLFTEYHALVPYVDMPLQHASDRMLRAMRRGHGGRRLYRLVDRLRESISNLSMRSAFIVGHPAESKDDFEELAAFVKWAEFDHLGVFQYSHEEGTLSGAMSDLVPAEVAQARAEELISIQQDISRRKLRTQIGSTTDVMIDGPSDETDLLMQGRTPGQAPEIDGTVYLANMTSPSSPGDVVRVRITDAADYDLLAEPIGAAREPRRLPLRLQ